jgi:hypothetical protein
MHPVRIWVAGVPLEHVRVIEHIRGNKWKTAWIEPNPGLFITLNPASWFACGRTEKRFFERKRTARGSSNGTRTKDIQKTRQLPTP